MFGGGTATPGNGAKKQLKPPAKAGGLFFSRNLQGTFPCCPN